MKITIEIMGGKNIEGKASCFAEFVQRHKFELSNANLKHTDLSGAKLTYANLRHADLSGADLRDADLLNADLSSTKLKGTNLAGADLSDANMKHADLRGADLDYASMFTLKCESFDATLDKRQMAQQAYHFCRHK